MSLSHISWAFPRCPNKERQKMLKSTVPTFIGRVVTYLKNSEGFNHLLTFGDYASRLAVLFGVASFSTRLLTERNNGTIRLGS